VGKFDFLVERLQRQTPEEFRQSLIRAGIHDEDMELADHYCSKVQLKEKRNRRKYRAGTTMFAIKINGKFAKFSGCHTVYLMDSPEQGTLWSRMQDARHRYKGTKPNRSGWLGLHLATEKRYLTVEDVVCIVEVNVTGFTEKWVDG